MAAENGAEPAEECRNPPNHLPQAAGRAGTHMRPNRPGPRKEVALHSSATESHCVLSSAGVYSPSNIPQDYIKT